jgi:hypothetical protein
MTRIGSGITYIAWVPRPNLVDNKLERASSVLAQPGKQYINNNIKVVSRLHSVLFDDVIVT